MEENREEQVEGFETWREVWVTAAVVQPSLWDVKIFGVEAVVESVWDSLIEPRLSRIIQRWALENDP